MNTSGHHVSRLCGAPRAGQASSLRCDPSVALDRPSTVTLCESSFAQVAGWAADPIPFDATLAETPARLVLIRKADLELQKAYYREGRHRLAPTDPVLVDPNTLQHWLWNRLAMPCERERR